jgi:membrane protein required for beta-lactamase induction
MSADKPFVVDFQLSFNELGLTLFVRLDRHPNRSPTYLLLMVIFALSERNKLLKYTRGDIYGLISTVLHVLILFGRAQRRWPIAFN